MYCRICGKQVPDGQELCSECKAESIMFSTKAQKVNEESDSIKKYGFSMALIGAIISVISYYLTIIIMAIFTGIKANSILSKFRHILPGSDLFNNFQYFSKTVGYILMPITILLAITSIVFGVISINRFIIIKNKKNSVKFAATLVLGIIATAIGAICIFTTLFSLIITLI